MIEVTTLQILDHKREYYKHYVYKFYNKNEMDKFFKRHILLNFTKEGIDGVLHGSVT